MKVPKDKELSAKYVIEEARSGNEKALRVIANYEIGRASCRERV